MWIYHKYNNFFFRYYHSTARVIRAPSDWVQDVYEHWRLAHLHLRRAVTQLFIHLF